MADWNWCQFGRDGVAIGGAAGDDQIRGVAGVEEGDAVFGAVALVPGQDDDHVRRLRQQSS